MLWSKEFYVGVPYKGVKLHKIPLYIMKAIEKLRETAIYGPPCMFILFLKKC